MSDGRVARVAHYGEPQTPIQGEHDLRTISDWLIEECYRLVRKWFRATEEMLSNLSLYRSFSRRISVRWWSRSIRSRSSTSTASSASMSIAPSQPISSRRISTQSHSKLTLSYGLQIDRIASVQLFFLAAAHSIRSQQAKNLSRLSFLYVYWGLYRRSILTC